MDTEQGLEIVLLLLGVAPEELKEGPEERDSWTIEFLAALATAAKQGSPGGQQPAAMR